MPIIKTKREDVLRNKEVDRMLKRAEKGVVNYRPLTSGPGFKDPNKIIFSKISFNSKMIQCLIALLWLFGKRITENLKLKREDIEIHDNNLYVHFFVLKKKRQKAAVIPHRKLKRMTLENPYVKYVLQYIETIVNPGAPLFPGRSRHQIVTVKNKELEKTYVYDQKHKPRMSRQHAYRILKGLDPKAWLHLFRHSVATEMAERGATQQELKDWFDWSRSATADKYVEGGPKLTEKWAKRKW